MKMYEVWEVKMSLNTNFDEKIVLWEPLTIPQSIKKTLYDRVLTSDDKVHEIDTP